MSRRPDRALTAGLAALALLLVAGGAASLAGAPLGVTVASQLAAFAAAIVLVRRALASGGAAELRAERDRLSSVAESCGVGLWLNPLPLGQLVWNGAVREHFHLPPGAPAPTIEGFFARLHPDDRAPTARAIEVALAARGLFDVEYRTVCPETGAVKFVRAVGRATYDAAGPPARFDGITLDLSAQKRAEAEAGDGDRRARAVLESIGDAFFALDRDWKFTYINRRSEELIGRPRAGLLGGNYWDSYGEAAGTEFERALRRAMGGEAAAVEAHWPPQDRWYEVNIYPSHDAAGGISVYFRDVTERHRAAGEIARLTDSAERERRLFEAALSNTSDLLYIFETDGRVAYANRALLELWGKSAAEAVGKTLRELEYAPEVESQILADIRRVAESRAPLTNETPYTSPTGVSGVYEYIFSPVLAAGPGSPVTQVAGSTRDITGRKLAEARLREAERFSRTLVEQVKDYAIFRTDPQGVATSWNEGVLRVLGYPEAEWLGRDTTPLIYTPEDIADDFPSRERAEAAATGRAGNDRTMVRSGGQRFFALGATTALRGPGGGLVGFTKVMRDQTDRKKLEDDLRQMASDLSEADRRKDEFLATLAHELRNPLAPLRTGLEVLKLGDGGTNGTGEKARAMMERQLKQMVRLVDDLLDVSRITRNKLELRTERVDLAAVLSSAVETSRPLIEASGHALEVEIAPEAMALSADFTRLAQVFSNLLNNAAKYTEAGGRITLRAGSDPDSPGRVAVAVADTGVGIPAAMLTSVFDMFTQVDRSIERSQGGLGIGLTLVKRLVEMHGGSVTAESEGVGRGSVFTVRLPLAGAPAVAALPAPSVPHAAASPKRRVLVVDDNVDSAASLSLLLGLTGNAVEVAYDGEAAVRAARDFAPDVILLDIGLPKLNGYEACRLIRKSPGGAGVVIVAQTGWGQDDDRQKSADAGFDFHLVKPVDPAALERLLAGLGK